MRRQEQSAKDIIQSCGLSLMEAAQVVLELKHSIDPELPLMAADCIRRIRWVSHAMREEQGRMRLDEAVDRLLESKLHRRETTLRELRYYTKKILTNNKEWAGVGIGQFNAEICREILARTFPNARSRCKARTILHGVFAFCCRSGWAERNPVAALHESPLPEKEIRPLTLEEIRRLLTAALLPQHLPCAAAAGLMLWSGIRPAEVARLSWKHIHCTSRTIVLHAQHTKTGGPRCISMQPVLVHWLRHYVPPAPNPEAAVCPRGWQKRWQKLHHACGLQPWVPDILRHSFASYHAAHFRNLEQLRWEMGHHSLSMLRFRYMATGYISRQQAACFWRRSYWEHVLPR